MAEAVCIMAVTTDPALPKKHLVTMKASMARRIKYHKILDAIIETITVNMMYVFVARQFSPKVSFHNDAMGITAFPYRPVAFRFSAFMLGIERVAVMIPARIVQRAPTAAIGWTWAKRTSHAMYFSVMVLVLASCQHAPETQTVEVAATSQGCSRAFVEEHAHLFAENIRLKEKVKLLQRQP